MRMCSEPLSLHCCCQLQVRSCTDVTMQQTVCHVIGSLASSKQGHVGNQQLHQTWSSHVNCMQAVACWLASAVHLTSGRCLHSKTCLGLICSGLPACGMTASATSHFAWPQYVASTICLKHPLFCSNLCCVLMTEQACQQGWSRLFLWAQLCAADCIHTSADRSAASTSGVSSSYRVWHDSP